MKIPPVHHARKWSAAVFTVLLLAARPSPAQWVEVSLHAETVVFRSSPSAPQAERWSTNTARCVFGTNLWLIEGQFTVNGMHSFWCTGTNIIEQVVINKESPERAENGRAPQPGIRRLPVGFRHTTIHRPWDRQPLVGIANLTWLAFCCGSFLKSDGRRIQPPFPPENRNEYSDRTQLFDNPLCLPERFELYQPGNGPLFCVYHVLQSTNIFGWTVPVRFDYAQYRTSGADAGRLYRRVTAEVTSVRESAAPLVPPEAMDYVTPKASSSEPKPFNF